MEEGAEINQYYYKKGPWTAEEDRVLVEHIRVHGIGQWNRIPKSTGLKRCGKSCRLRWLNYLSPNVKRGCFSEEEEDLIIRLHKLLGNRWALIAGRVPGRTDNQVKNHWNTHLRKKVNIGIININNENQSRKVIIHHDHVANSSFNQSPLVEIQEISTSPAYTDSNISEPSSNSTSNNGLFKTNIMEEVGVQNYKNTPSDDHDHRAYNFSLDKSEHQVPQSKRSKFDDDHDPKSTNNLMVCSTSSTNDDFSDILINNEGIVEFLDSYCPGLHPHMWQSF